VGKLGRRADLGQEPLDAHGCRDLSVQDLDGNRTVVSLIACLVDRGHPARPELTLETITTGKSGRDAGLDGHGTKGRAKRERMEGNLSATLRSMFRAFLSR